MEKLRQRIFFFFFGDQHKIGEKDASIGVITFFFYDEKIFGIFTLSLERSHYFRIFAEGENLEGTLALTLLKATFKFLNTFAE